VGELACAECGRESRDDENAEDEWRAYRDTDDDLPVFCPECAEREFGSGPKEATPAARRGRTGPAVDLRAHICRPSLVTGRNGQQVREDGEHIGGEEPASLVGRSLVVGECAAAGS
jgi:hypothetical protein